MRAIAHRSPDMLRWAPQGFTLIELLVVIAIIGVLSAVVLASLNTARTKGNDAQRESNLKSIQTALELYYSAHGAYPSSSSWSSECTSWGGTNRDDAIPGLVADKDIAQLPHDSQMSNPKTCCYLYKSNGTDYKYLFYNCPTSLACYGSSEANSGLGDPQRPTNGCAVYTPGAVTW